MPRSKSMTKTNWKRKDKAYRLEQNLKAKCNRFKFRVLRPMLNAKF